MKKVVINLTAWKTVSKEAEGFKFDDAKTGWDRYAKGAKNKDTEVIKASIQVVLAPGPPKKIIITWDRTGALQLTGQVLIEGGQTVIRLIDPARQPRECWEIHNPQKGGKQEKPIKPKQLFIGKESVQPHCSLSWEILDVIE